jgi:hypothetical protein
MSCAAVIVWLRSALPRIVVENALDRIESKIAPMIRLNWLNGFVEIIGYQVTAVRPPVNRHHSASCRLAEFIGCCV